MAYRWIELMGGYDSARDTGWTPSGVNVSQTRNFSNVHRGDSPFSEVIYTMLPITWQITDTFKIVLTDNSGQMRYTFYDNNTEIWHYEDWIGTDYNRYCIGFAVDDTLQRGLFMLGEYRPGATSLTWRARPVTNEMAAILYPYFIAGEVPPVVYTWSSVPAISGNGKTYRLTDILNINDGNAVNDVSPTGNVDFSAQSKANNLIDAVLQDDSKVTVNYTIPEGTYEYIKLVYKKDRIPNSYTDGTAINITQSSTSQQISGISDGSTYWFVIFTDKSESEPYKFTPDFVASVLYDGSLPSGQQFPAGVSYDLGNIEDTYSLNIPTIESDCIRITEQYSVAPFIVFNSRLAICSTLKLLVKRTGNINGALHILGGVDNSQYTKLEPNINNRSVYNIESASRPESFNAYYHLEDMPLDETVELTITLPQTSEGLYIAILSGIGVDIYKIWGL